MGGSTRPRVGTWSGRLPSQLYWDVTVGAKTNIDFCGPEQDCYRGHEKREDIEDLCSRKEAPKVVPASKHNLLGRRERRDRKLMALVISLSIAYKNEVFGVSLARCAVSFFGSAF